MTTRARPSNCIACGEPIGNGEFCKRCGNEMRNMYNDEDKRNGQFKRFFDHAEFEIVEDMTQQEAGGFSPGSKINRVNMVALLKAKTLAKGTIVKHIPTGDLYHVDYRKEIEIR